MLENVSAGKFWLLCQSNMYCKCVWPRFLRFYCVFFFQVKTLKSLVLNVIKFQWSAILCLLLSRYVLKLVQNLPVFYSDRMISSLRKTGKFCTSFRTHTSATLSDYACRCLSLVSMFLCLCLCVFLCLCLCLCVSVFLCVIPPFGVFTKISTPRNLCSRIAYQQWQQPFCH